MTYKNTLQELIIPVESIDATTVSNFIIDTVRKRGLPIKTLTLDNGFKFSRHELIAPIP